MRHGLEASGAYVSEAFDNDDAAKVEAAAAGLPAIPQAMATIMSARDAIKGRGKAGAPGRRAAGKAMNPRVDQRNRGHLLRVGVAGTGMRIPVSSENGPDASTFISG